MESGKEEDVQNASNFTWLCLIILLLVAMGNQWQRYVISYANAIGTKNDDPKTEILTAYPELKD